MKALRFITLIILLSTLAWTGLEFFKLLNSEISFFGLKQVPISLAFFISILLFALSIKSHINKVSLIFLISSTLVLVIALFTEVNYNISFKVESMLLLFFGAHTFSLFSKKKTKIFSIIYYMTALLFGITILTNVSNSSIHLLQGVFLLLTTISVMLSLFVKKFN